MTVMFDSVHVRAFRIASGFAACLTLVLGSKMVAVAEDKIPPDGYGLKWSTLKLQGKTIPGPDGTSVFVPEIRYPDPTKPALVAFGYDVDVDPPVEVGGKRVTRIKMWLVPEQAPPGFPKDLNWNDIRYDCHGRTFGGGTFSPDGSQVPAILTAGWEEIECLEKTAKGSIIVYYDAQGKVLHSATANGDGTYTTKNGTKKEEPHAKKEDMDKEYGTPKYPGGRTRCYRPKKK